MPIRRWAPAVGVSVDEGAVDRKRGEDDLTLIVASDGRSDSRVLFGCCIFGLIFLLRDGFFGLGF